MSKYILYVEGRSFFHSLDPRAKIAFVVCVFVWSSVFNHPLYTGTVLAAVLAMVLSSGVASRLKMFWFGLVSLAVMSLVLWPLFRRGGETVLFQLAGVAFTQESVMYALAVAFRLVAMVLSGLLLLTTSRIEDLELALTKLGMPYSMAFGVSAVFRFIPAMVGDGLTILAAQRARGVNLVKGSVFSRMRNSAAVIVPLFITTMRRFGELPLAIESRGFVPTAKRSYLLDLRFRARDAAFTATVLFLAALSVYLRLNGYGVVFPHVI